MALRLVAAVMRAPTNQFVVAMVISCFAELEILLMRSCFPVHQICAAIQSIGICRRDVEKDGTQLGQAVLPAVLLHGTFDFALMLAGVLHFIHEDIPEGEGTTAPSDPNETENHLEMPSVLSMVLSAAITGAGLAYYFHKSNEQKQRLNAMVSVHDDALALT